MKTENKNSGKPSRTADQKIDKELKDTFPASDPPSYSSGAIGAGAPKGRESEPKTGEAPEVRERREKSEVR